MGYSLVGFGPAVVNDFKSLEGDTKFGLKSIPVLYGVDTAKWIACSVHDFVQVGVATYLYSIGKIEIALLLFGLLLPQMMLQKQLLWDQDPLENDMKYIAVSQPFVVLGLLATALSIGGTAT